MSVVKMIAPGFQNSAVLSPITLGARPTRRRAGETGAVVFVGPSWPHPILPDGFERRPPARVGDLATMLIEGPPAIVGLIDGIFETAPGVWHKEILDLLAHGVAVFGAASLGALRAAELCPFGMVGVGEVFTAYRNGLISRDDAVMVTHAPAELAYHPLTISLVDAEVAIGSLAISARDRRMLQRVMRTLSFRERTWARCIDVIEQRSGCAREDLRRQLSATMPSVKRADAEALIAAMATWRERPIRPSPVTVPMTIQYRALLSRLGQAHASTHLVARLAP